MGNLSECKKIAVIDTETNYDDDVISIGAVIADSSSYKVEDKIYMLVYPECTRPAMFSEELYHPSVRIDLKAGRSEVITALKVFLDRHGIKNIFAYNSSFDERHLPELYKYDWYDIMKVAAYKQYNPTITSRDCLCSTGRLSTGYGVETILGRLCIAHARSRHLEVHNALTDAIDEAEVMELLGHELTIYDPVWRSELEKKKKENETRPGNDKIGGFRQKMKQLPFYYAFINLSDYSSLHLGKKDCKNPVVHIRKPLLESFVYLLVFCFSEKIEETGLYCILRIGKRMNSYISSYGYASRFIKQSDSAPLLKMDENFSLPYIDSVLDYAGNRRSNDYDSRNFCLSIHPIKHKYYEEITHLFFPTVQGVISETNKEVEYHGRIASSAYDIYALLFPSLSPSAVTRKVKDKMDKTNMNWQDAVDELSDEIHAEEYALKTERYGTSKISDYFIKFNGKTFTSCLDFYREIFPDKNSLTVSFIINETINKGNIPWYNALRDCMRNSFMFSEEKINKIASSVELIRKDQNKQ